MASCETGVSTTVTLKSINYNVAMTFHS